MGSGPITPFRPVNDATSTDARAGDRLRRLRRERGLTQEELAQATGVSRSAVAQWESGRSGLANKLRRIAAALDVPVRDLGRSGEPPGASDEGPRNPEEAELLHHFRHLDAADQVSLVHLIHRLLLIRPDR